MADNLTLEQIYVCILQKELCDFVKEENIYIQEQNVKLPNNKETYVAVRMVDAQVKANANNYSVDENGVMTEIQQTQQLENIQVDIFGRNRDPLLKRWRIQTALNSLIAKQHQERYNFKVYKIPTVFVNATSVEGGSQFTRFSITIANLVMYERRIEHPDAGCFDKFPTRVDDEETIGQENGLIEFEINEDSNP